MDVPQLVYPFICEGNSGCFPFFFLVVMTRAAVYICVQVFFFLGVDISFQLSEKSNLGPMENVHLTS